MVRWLIRILVQAGVLGLVTLPPLEWVSVRGVGTAILAVLLISILSALARPLLFVLRILTIPLSCLTLGLFSVALSFGANVLILWVVDRLLPGMSVHGVWALLGTALVLGISATVIGLLTRRGPRRPAAPIALR